MRSADRSRLTLAALLLLPGLAWGANVGRDDAFVPDPESVRPKSIEEGEAWKEGRVTLPPWPSDSDLQEFEPDGPPGPFRFYIDTRHLSTDTQGAVVRYVVVAESGSGTRNVSYEGIRCTLRGGYKVYAYGAGGRFAEAEETDWLPIPTTGSEAYREDLWRNRFCVPRETRVKPVREMIRSLKGRGVPREHTGFQAD